MAFVTYWLEKAALKALSSIVSDGNGTIFKIGLPLVKEQPPVSKATWDGELDEMKLYVVGIPTVTAKAEVLAEFMKDGNCEVHMMQNNALVKFGDKKNAARAIKRLHNKFMFPGCSSSRFISVRYARKNSYNTPSAKNPPSRKPSKVTWPLYVPPSSYHSPCVFYCTQATAANRQLGTKSYNAPSAKNQPSPKPSKVPWPLYLPHSSLDFILCFLLYTVN